MVHLKTADSVALPVYHSLPPEAKLLAPLEEGPAEKRVKLSSVGVEEEEEEEEEEVEEEEEKVEEEKEEDVVVGSEGHKEREGGMVKSVAVAEPSPSEKKVSIRITRPVC